MLQLSKSQRRALAHLRHGNPATHAASVGALVELKLAFYSVRLKRFALTPHAHAMADVNAITDVRTVVTWHDLNFRQLDGMKHVLGLEGTRIPHQRTLASLKYRMLIEEDLSKAAANGEGLRLTHWQLTASGMAVIAYDIAWKKALTDRPVLQ